MSKSAKIDRKHPFQLTEQERKESSTFSPEWSSYWRRLTAAGKFNRQALEYTAPRYFLGTVDEIRAAQEGEPNPETESYNSMCLKNLFSNLAIYFANRSVSRAAAATLLARSATGAMPHANLNGSLPWLSVLSPDYPPLAYERISDSAFRMWIIRPPPTDSALSLVMDSDWTWYRTSATVPLTPPPPFGNTEIKDFIVEIHLPDP